MNSSNGKAQVVSLWWRVWAIFVLAVLFNYAWEMAQSPLYVGMSFSEFKVWWHCFKASLGDGLDVLLIFAVGWILLGKQDWYEKPGFKGYALILVMGLAISIGIELVAVYVLERWEYTEQMPLVPGLGVGISPVAQMVVLPAVTFYTVASWRKARARQNKD